MCDGGASVYYSHALKMLFFSYQNGVCINLSVTLCNNYFTGKSYMASISDDLSMTKMAFEISLKKYDTLHFFSPLVLTPLLSAMEETSLHLASLL